MTKEELIKQEYSNLLENVYKRSENKKIKETLMQSAAKVVEAYYISKKEQTSNMQSATIQPKDLYEAVKWCAYHMSDNHHNSYYAVAVATAFSMSSQERKEYSLLSPKELYQKEKKQNIQDEREL